MILQSLGTLECAIAHRTIESVVVANVVPQIGNMVENEPNALVTSEFMSCLPVLDKMIQIEK